MAFGRCNADGLEFAALDVADQPRNIAKKTTHVPGDHVGNGRCRAFVGHVQDVYFGGVVEQLHRQVGHAAGAAGGHGHFRVGFSRGGHHFRAGVVGRVGGHHQHLDIVDDQRHRGQVPHRVIGQFFIQRRVDCYGADAGEPQRGGIWRSPRDKLGGNGAVAPCLVLHDHLLAQLLAQLFGDGAGDKINRPAGRESDDHAGDFGLCHDGYRQSQRRCGHGLCEQAAAQCVWGGIHQGLHW